MEKLYLLIVSVLFSFLTGMLAYWIRGFHAEIKRLLKELMELNQLIVIIQTQIDKGIEADILEIKEDIKTLYSRTNRVEGKVAALVNRRDVNDE